MPNSPHVALLPPLPVLYTTPIATQCLVRAQWPAHSSPVFPQPTIFVQRMIHVSVRHTARHVVPALAAHHAPFFTRVNRAPHEQVYLTSTEVTGLTADVLVGGGKLAFALVCFALSLVNFALALDGVA